MTGVQTCALPICRMKRDRDRVKQVEAVRKRVRQDEEKDRVKQVGRG